MLLNLAWRNIWRNKMRSILVIMSIAVGLWAGIFVMAFSYGMYRSYIKEMIRYQLSHIQVHHPKFVRDHDVRDTVPEAMLIVSMLKKYPEVKQTVLRSRGIGMLMSPAKSYGIKITGIDPVMENNITDLSKFIEEGNYLSDSTGKQLLIGKKLAEKLKAGIKSKLVIMLQGSDGNIVSGAYRVTGIFRTKNSTFDEANIFIRRNDFNELIGSDKSVAHEIAILLNDEKSINQIQSVLQSTFPELKTENFRELSPEMDLVIESFNEYMYIFIGIILMALMFGIVNTQLMAVLERQRELGMLMAIGMNKFRLFSMIMMETAFLALTGGPLGILLSYITISWFGIKGIDLSFFSKGLEFHGFSNIVYPFLELNRYWPVFFMTIGIAILSAIYPAIKALKLNPSESIRKI